MENSGRIYRLSISPHKGDRKQNVSQVTMDLKLGIIGDAHGTSDRPVSLLPYESFAKLNHPELDILPGDFAENITTEGVDLKQCALFDRFEIGDVVLEVTQIGKECHGSSCSIFREVGKCIMPVVGIFARVIQGGMIKKGTSIKFIKTPLRFEIITLSDRAAAGEYEDNVVGNSGWATGDWNGDSEFTTSDLVTALSGGGYEVGPRAAVAAVPEPHALILFALGLLSALGYRRPH